MSSAAAATAPTLACSSLPEALVEQWLEHCAHCFADKLPHPPPKSYFQTHLQSDPMRDLNGVAIVQVESKEAEGAEESKEAGSAGQRVIASTARVFVRRQYLNGKQVMLGGIGEVCSRPEYRKQGYADLCLRRCLAYCRRLRLQLGSLHADESLVEFYAKHGFASVPRWFGVKSDFEQEKDPNIVGEGARHGAFALRLMPAHQFFDPTVFPQFQRMYESHSARFNGPTVRSEEYWQKWVRDDVAASVEAKHRFPLEIYAAYEEWDGSDPPVVPASPVRFLAYMFLQRQYLESDDGKDNRDRLYIVREYAAAPQWVDRPDGGRQIFLSLLTYAVRQIRHKFAQADPHAAAKAKISVKFPLPLVSGFAEKLSLDDEQEDKGFLWRALPLEMDPKAPLPGEQASRSEWRGQQLEESAITSPFAALPYVLHHDSEPMKADTAEQMLEEIKNDAKNKLLFWQTDGF